MGPPGGQWNVLQRWLARMRPPRDARQVRLATCRVTGLVTAGTLESMLEQAFAVSDIVAQQPFRQAHVELGSAHAHVGVMALPSEACNNAVELQRYSSDWAANTWHGLSANAHVKAVAIRKDNYLITSSNAAIVCHLEAFLAARKIRYVSCLPAVVALLSRHLPRLHGDAHQMLLVREQGALAARRTLHLALLDRHGPVDIARVLGNEAFASEAPGYLVRRMGCRHPLRDDLPTLEHWWPDFDSAQGN